MAAFSAPPIGCLLMAAGNASRFGENKLTARFDGQSLFSRALEAIPAGVFVRVTVVSQYPSLLEEASQAGFDAILNDRPEDGISRTIRLGTPGDGGLCPESCTWSPDQPLLQAGTVRRIVDAWQEHPNCITAAAHNGKRGNPCLFPSRFFPELCALEADRGGSSVIRRHEDALLLVEAGERELFDCDTKQALEILKGNA